MHNFNPELERAHQDGTEWIFGAVDTDLGLVPVNVRVNYAPKGVLQYNNVTDSNGCASRAPLNILETKLTYMVRNDILHPAIVEWLYDTGYIVFD